MQQKRNATSQMGDTAQSWLTFLQCAKSPHHKAFMPKWSNIIRWIHASMPKQGIGIMDCGVFMMCMVGLYINSRLGWLPMAASHSTYYKPTNFTNVKIIFKYDATTVKGVACDHMLSAVHLGFCDLEAFNLRSIEWPELTDIWSFQFYRIALCISSISL